MSIGHKGMLFASKSLGTTMVDLFEKTITKRHKRRVLQRKGRKFGKHVT
jgi:hypothetical protein